MNGLKAHQICDGNFACVGFLFRCYSDPAFRSVDRSTRTLSDRPLPQANLWAMLQRRAAASGIGTRVGCHTFGATGITAYLNNGGTLERAAAMANHASTRTTQLYDRRRTR